MIFAIIPVNHALRAKDKVSKKENLQFMRRKSEIQGKMKHTLLSSVIFILFTAGYSQSDGLFSEEKEFQIAQLKIAETVQADSVASLPAELVMAAEVSHQTMLHFTPAYPNPAGKRASIDYALHGETGNVKFVLLNLLGSKVKEIEITEKTGSVRLNTSGLTEGIYFYSFLINNESYVTRKLIIKH